MHFYFYNKINIKIELKIYTYIIVKGDNSIKARTQNENQINVRKIKCHRMRAKQLRDCIAREKIYWTY
jgi:hypothetical protein